MRRSGAEPTTSPALEYVNLIELLDPKGEAEQGYEKKAAAAEQQPRWSKLPPSVKYDLVFASFGEQASHASRMAQRNLVQNRLVAASDRRCGRFFQFLKKDNSDSNMVFATAASVFSVAGALVPGLQAAKNLSGASALTSGLRAEYNNEYFSNLAVSVITKAIDEKRTELRRNLTVAQHLPYSRYDVAAAVADAVRYDASCNVTAGLEQANEALQRLSEPGRDAINRALFKDGIARAILTTDENAIARLTQLQPLLQVNSAYAAPVAPDEPANADSAEILLPLASALAALRKADALFVDSMRLAQSAIDASKSKNDAATLGKFKDQINGVINTAKADYLVRFKGDKATQIGVCIAEAQALETPLVAAQNAVQLATATGAADLRQKTDRLEDEKSRAARFASKMSRQVTAAQEALAAATASVKKAAAMTPLDVDAIAKALTAALTSAEIDKGVGAERMCVAPAAAQKT